MGHWQDTAVCVVYILKTVRRLLRSNNNIFQYAEELIFLPSFVMYKIHLIPHAR